MAHYLSKFSTARVLRRIKPRGYNRGVVLISNREVGF